MMLFKDRADAGKKLAERLTRYSGKYKRITTYS
jgi:predicted phosphoribosyltransferase